MARAERSPELSRMLADHETRLRRVERGAAFTDPRQTTANAGGLYSPPVPLTAPDASGFYTVTAAVYADVAMFVGGSFGAFWVLVQTNGVSTDWSFQVVYPAQSGRVLGTSVYRGAHPVLGDLHMAACDVDSDLAVAATPYAASVTVQGQTANSATSNRCRIIASGWGVPNV